MKTMKLQVLTVAVAASAVVLTGCVNPDGTQNNTGSGALIGGATGALAGAAIGGRHGGPDALIGAAAGMLAGALIGSAADQERDAQMRAAAPPGYLPAAKPMSLSDIKAMAKAGVGDDTIINQIQVSRTVFHLTASDIISLRKAGVSEQVVDFMINSPGIMAAAPVMPAPPAYVQAAPPAAPAAVSPGPGYVWVGGEWVWNGGWIWVAGHWAYPPYPQAVWVTGRCWHDAAGWHSIPGHWG